MSIQRNLWNEAETSVLKAFVDKYGITKGTEKASKKLGRTQGACSQRYYYIKENEVPTVGQPLNSVEFDIKGMSIDLTKRKMVISF